MNAEKPFKTCSCCFHVWQTRDDFLSDPKLEFIGYQVNFKKLAYGMFFFNHTVDSCQSTMTIMVEDFRDLYSGQCYTGSKAMTDDCPRYCLDEKQFSRCDAMCECAFAREIMQTILEKQGCSAT